MTRHYPEPFTAGQGVSHLLVIHGWFSDHRLFDDLVAELDPGHFTTARFDIRGYGRSRDIEGRFDLDEVADDAMAIADELGWPRFSIVGHSMGGKVAQKLAIAHPGRVASVAAVTPVPATPLGLDDDTRAFFARAAEEDEVAQAIVAQSVGSSRDATWVAGLVRQTRQTARHEAFARYANSFIDDDLSAGADILSAPLLILFGAEDRGVDHAFLDPLYRALYRDARIEVIPETGHYPMVDDPAALARRLAAFFESLA
ncbi:MAG: alpha/beta hydrolase [Candidatus Sphingomonas phytovorans]|nr:alpha/beta hydrolase [Sphingomonas sp.]WEK02308.1 MAG: alpha/beta hydrolase [Sphingomonas sp.]